MYYFDEVPTKPYLYVVEGDPHLLKEFTAYLLVRRAPFLVLDGGNSFNPFTISFFCRKLQIDSMEKIFVSRAFTVFQLKMLITHELPLLIRKENPSGVVVSFYSDLFHSDDVEEEVLTILHQKLLVRLKEIVRTYNIPVIVTDRANDSPLFDCRISFRIRRNALLLSIDKNTLSYPLVPATQKTLDHWRDHHG
jgi:hypothetical protein